MAYADDYADCDGRLNVMPHSLTRGHILTLALTAHPASSVSPRTFPRPLLRANCLREHPACFARQVEPKLVSGAKISDATQVMQSTITPASAPKSNIFEKRYGPEPKTVDQARRGVPCLYPLHDAHMRPLTLSRR